MAGNQVSAADGALDRGSKIVAESRQQLTGQLKSLEGKLSGMSSMWKGQAATSFTTLMQQWHADSTKIISALDNFEQNLKTSQSGYDGSDQSGQSTFSKLQGRLG